MPFLNLNNNWSDLSKYYNQNFNSKPEIPAIRFNDYGDGLIRGGILNTTLASVRDTARISKFYASGRGVLFIIKQVGLQKSNPELELPANNGPISNTNLRKLNVRSSSSLVNKAANAINTVSTVANNYANKIGPTRTYNLGINTLAQIPLNAIGGHIIRHGLTPVGGVGFLGGDSSTIQGYNYEKITNDNNILQGSAIGFSKGFYDSDYYGKNPNRLMNYLSIINNNDNGVTNLLTYDGGASSVYGIGQTRINTTNVRTTIGKSILTPGAEKNLNGFTPLTNNQISIAPQAELNSSLKDQLTNSPLSINNNESSFNIESRVGISRGSKNPINRKVDSINAISILNNGTFYDNSLATNSDASSKTPGLFTYSSGSKSEVNGESKFGRDIIKFRLEFLNNNVSSTVTDVLAFRAYIDDFSDGMNAKWNPYRYMGRGEEFYVYDGFTRDISVAFTMYAHSPEEMKPLYQKLNYLMSTFAPDYSDKLKMRGNIGYLTVGDYLYRQPGVFTDIKLSGFLDIHWEIALNDPEDGSDAGQYETPKHIKVALSFKPIHTFLPRRAYKDTLSKVPFITRDKAAYNLPINKYLD